MNWTVLTGPLGKIPTIWTRFQARRKVDFFQSLVGVFNVAFPKKLLKNPTESYKLNFTSA